MNKKGEKPILEDCVYPNGSIQLSIETIAGPAGSNTPFRNFIREAIESKKLEERQNKLQSMIDDIQGDI